MENILELRDISHSYHGKEGETIALSHLSFSLSRGDFVSIVGPSGCGKSTILSIISGLIPPEYGEVILHGSHIGYMLQKDHLLEWRSVYRNIILGLEIQHKVSPVAKENAFELLQQYGLLDFSNAKPSELSGGMRQRAALIRTLILDPDLLLLDEPFSALDMLTKGTVHEWYLDVMERIHLSTLFITHDIDEAILLSDRIYLLSGQPGRITAELVIKEPKPRSADFNLTPEFLEYKRKILSML